MYLWVENLKNKKVLFNIYNIAFVSIVNKQSLKDKLIMKLIRRFVLITI